MECNQRRLALLLSFYLHLSRDYLRYFAQGIQLLLVFSLLVLFTFTEPASIENDGDMLFSIDIIAFGYSRDASQH
jgi:hypothetical protein